MAHFFQYVLLILTVFVALKTQAADSSEQALACPLEYSEPIDLPKHPEELLAHLFEEDLDDLPIEYIYQIEKNLLQNMTSFSSYQLGRIMNILVKLHEAHPFHPPNQELLLGIEENFINTANAWSESPVDADPISDLVRAKIINGFASLRVIPRREMMDSWFNLMVQRGHRMNGDSLPQSIVALARLGIKLPSRTAKSWRSSLIASMRSIKSYELTFLIYGLSLMKAALPEPVTLALERALSKIEPSHSEAHMLYMASLFARVSKNKRMIRVTAPFSTPISFYVPPTSSRLQEIVENELRRRGHSDFISEYEIPETKLPVDIYFPESRTIFQVDGPHHLLYDRDTRASIQRPIDITMDKLLKSLGYKVVRIHYQTVDDSQFEWMDKF